MATYVELDVDSIARTGLLFLNGDSLEEILLDKYGHVDYDFDKFNDCKKAIMRIERINPDADLCAVLWQLRPDNTEMAVPVAAGASLPLEGWQVCPAPQGVTRVLGGESTAVIERGRGIISHYYPVKNSDAEPVGVLELIQGNRVKVDI